jgi:predicted Zn finger-like uncharacterized protein
MKFVCHACSARYYIDDAKVAGRVLQIRCKRCGATLTVREPTPFAGAPTSPVRATVAARAINAPPAEYQVPGTGPDEGPVEGLPPLAEAEAWHYSLNGETFGPYGEDELIARYEQGGIGDETYVWRPGYAEWLPAVDVPVFEAAVERGRAARHRRGGPRTVQLDAAELASLSHDPNAEPEVLIQRHGTFATEPAQQTVATESGPQGGWAPSTAPDPAAETSPSAAFGTHPVPRVGMHDHGGDPAGAAGPRRGPPPMPARARGQTGAVDAVPDPGHAPVASQATPRSLPAGQGDGATGEAGADPSAGAEHPAETPAALDLAPPNQSASGPELDTTETPAVSTDATMPAGDDAEGEPEPGSAADGAPTDPDATPVPGATPAAIAPADGPDLDTAAQPALDPLASLGAALTESAPDDEHARALHDELRQHHAPSRSAAVASARPKRRPLRPSSAPPAVAPAPEPEPAREATSGPAASAPSVAADAEAVPETTAAPTADAAPALPELEVAPAPELAPERLLPPEANVYTTFGAVAVEASKPVVVVHAPAPARRGGPVPLVVAAIVVVAVVAFLVLRPAPAPPPAPSAAGTPAPAAAAPAAVAAGSGDEGSAAAPAPARRPSAAAMRVALNRATTGIDDARQQGLEAVAAALSEGAVAGAVSAFRYEDSPATVARATPRPAGTASTATGSSSASGGTRSDEAEARPTGRSGDSAPARVAIGTEPRGTQGLFGQLQTGGVAPAPSITPTLEDPGASSGPSAEHFAAGLRSFVETSIQRCHQRQVLEEGSMPSQRVQIELVVAPNGRVSEVSVGRTLQDTTFDRCLQGHRERWSFPPFAGEAVTLQKTYVLQ